MTIPLKEYEALTVKALRDFALPARMRALEALSLAEIQDRPPHRSSARIFGQLETSGLAYELDGGWRLTQRGWLEYGLAANEEDGIAPK